MDRKRTIFLRGLIGLVFLMLCAKVFEAQGLPVKSFETATIKLAPPNADENSGYWSYPGKARFTAHHVSLAQLIALAYGIDSSLIYNEPSWVQSSLFDVEAKPEDGISLTAEELHPRLQQLLAERFNLVVHWEQKSVSGLAVVIGKHGQHLIPTKGAPFPGYFIDLTPGQMRGKDWSMTQLAKYLTRAAKVPVVDETGLSGSFDIEFSYEPNPDIQSDLKPLDLALEDATGLVLKPTKVKVQGLVIDSVQRTFVPN